MDPAGWAPPGSEGLLALPGTMSVVTDTAGRRVGERGNVRVTSWVR
ncbi:hypothetical protein HMPREF0059_02682 [Actinomyces viscosus C505]|uniref:Uncharacterized protein n=1 Tax=Actinomyces viscosus C505 TaxID=562973 RepID=T5LGQ5_ACTVI|nr:hypothetical protein HMPREF0059_02682 [Actinomyces viscosus C505]